VIAIRLSADWHYRERRTETGPPDPRNKTHRPDRRETHAKLNQVRVTKEVATDDIGKRAGNMDQQQ
jgi:hypothetical protein